MLVVALAANVVKRLATGLREGFQPLVHQVLPGMLGKFKEKMTVVTAFRKAVDAVYLTAVFSPEFRGRGVQRGRVPFFMRLMTHIVP